MNLSTLRARNWVYGGSAVLLLLSSVALKAQSGRSRSPAVRAPRACGVERWRVKILADEDRERIRWSPETTSVAALRQIHSPSSAYPAARRIAPYELRLYRVHAIVRQILAESDGDWHVVIADPDDLRETLVTEIPDSSCALGSGHEAEYAAARRALRAIPRGALVVLDGVGFFDYLHGQRGMAPNGFELHPVVAIRALEDQQESGHASPQPALARTPAPRQRADTASLLTSDPQVWLNTNSLVYHCAGTRWYGATRYGEFVRESEAEARGARAAYGRHCGTITAPR
jgi:hypothetical protein